MMSFRVMRLSSPVGTHVGELVSDGRIVKVSKVKISVILMDIEEGIAKFVGLGL